eukprot:GHUV01052656.1.p1 GENE.GHUV01052656.1~~GHUV01052656.1.p1  ORF type:complete len:188 (+),score=37.55 GHUV01052656.1:30-593(+)
MQAWPCGLNADRPAALYQHAPPSNNQAVAVCSASSIVSHHSGLLMTCAGTSSWQSAMSQARGYSLANSSCADASLENVVRWTLMQDMDDICGWPGPVTLACNRLLSPPQLCTAETTLSDPTGNITDGVPLGDMYSASSSCTWTINTPEQMYITLNFSKFQTEQLYDVVTVEVSFASSGLASCAGRYT